MAVLLAVALCVAVITGVIAHEGLHLIVLRLGGIEATLEVRRRDPGGPVLGVQPTGPVRRSPHVLRLAALAPLCLLFVAVGASVGLSSVVGDGIATMLMVGWFACALPSPSDFAIAIHAPVTATLDRPSSAPSNSPAEN